jgi:iron complex outermembrane receptor protein
MRRAFAIAAASATSIVAITTPALSQSSQPGVQLPGLTVETSRPKAKAKRAARPAQPKQQQRSIAATQPTPEADPEPSSGGLGSSGASRQTGPAYTRDASQAATRTGTPSIEVPFSIGVVSDELLEERRPLDVARAVETIPGVSIGYGGGFTQSGRLRIRGFSAISSFKDGFRINAAASETDLANIDSIEVLKGPASALFGRFEPGGIVNFVTKNPTAERFVETWNTVGSNGFVRSSVDMGGALNETGTVLGRFNAAFQQSDGFRDFGDNDRIFVAPALTFKPSDNTTITLKGEYLNMDSPFDRGLPGIPLSFSVPISRNYAEPWMRLEKEQWFGSVEILHKIDPQWQVRLAAHAGETDVKEAYINYGAGWPPAILTPGGDINRRFIKGTEGVVDRSVQAELLGLFNTGPIHHKFLIGVDAGHDTWRYDLRITGNQPINAINPIYGTNPPDAAYTGFSTGYFTYNSQSIYAQDEMAWGPFRLLVGGRLERTKGTVEDVEFGPSPAESDTVTSFSPRVGLTYFLTSELALYASWARSTRFEVDSGPLATGTLPNPTTGEQFEVGAKGRFFNGLLQPTISLFDLTKADAIVFDPNALGGFGGNVQTGELKVRGIEVEIAAQPTKAWKILAGYTYQDAYISEDADPSLVGNQLQNVPKNIFSLWTAYNFGTESQGLTVGGGVFYSSDRPTLNANTLFTPSYWRLDAFAAYKFSPKTQLILNVNNVLDEKYYVVGGFGMIHPQPPREVFLTLNHKF